ncbi:MAG: hypothetical protein QM742_16510 [Aquabacterium sp.]
MKQTPATPQTPRSEQASHQAIEREKTAIENTTQGYGSTVKSKIISAKPDGDTQGAQGANNDHANVPADPRSAGQRGH